MTRRPRIPGLSDEWAQRQLELPREPVCRSCTLMRTHPSSGQREWECDPDRPGCPLHQTPEQTR